MKRAQQSRKLLNVAIPSWADVATGQAGISLVAKHRKNELKIGSNQAGGINLVSGPVPWRGTSCPNHKLGSDMGRCQCSKLPAGAQTLSLLPGRRQAKPLGQILGALGGHGHGVAWCVLPKVIVPRSKDEG